MKKQHAPVFKLAQKCMFLCANILALRVYVVLASGYRLLWLSTYVVVSCDGDIAHVPFYVCEDDFALAYSGCAKTCLWKIYHENETRNVHQKQTQWNLFSDVFVSDVKR